MMAKVKDEPEISISANEINKFTYCPHQWYYGRVYGQKELSARYHELHPDAEHGNPRFERGRAFHEDYGNQEGKTYVFTVAAVIAAVIVVLIFLKYMGII